MKKTETIDICGSGTFPKGNPCHVPNTNIGSYYPNVSSGYNATARSYIGGLDDRFEPFKLTESTNPYIHSSSSFPTFTPPTFTPPLFVSIGGGQSKDSKDNGFSAPQITPEASIFRTNLYKNYAQEKVLDYTSGLGQNSNGKCNVGEQLEQLIPVKAPYNFNSVSFAYSKMDDQAAYHVSTLLIKDNFNFDSMYYCHNNITDTGMFPIVSSLKIHPTLFHCVVKLDMSKNQLTDASAHMFYTLFTTNELPYLKVLNLADNNITDTGAGYLAQSLKSGGNKLNIIHVEGNKIGPKGEKYFVTELLDKAVQHMIIYTQSHKGQFDEHVRMIFGTKEERSVIFKKLITQGIEKGVNVEAIVVDQTLLGKINNGIDLTTTNIKTFFGFIKCNFDPIDMIKSYTADKIIAKLPKSVSKLMGEIKTTEGAVSCYFEAHNEAWTSESGLNVLTHELCVTGENGFCGE